MGLIIYTVSNHPLYVDLPPVSGRSLLEDKACIYYRYTHSLALGSGWRMGWGGAVDSWAALPGPCPTDEEGPSKASVPESPRVNSRLHLHVSPFLFF